MKKILSVLVCVFLGITSAWSSDLNIQAQAFVYNNEGGQVAANNSATPPSSGWNSSATNTITKSHDGSSGGNFLGSGKTFTWNGYQLYYHATPYTGYIFMGWSNDDNNTIDGSQTTTPLDLSSTITYSKAASSTQWSITYDLGQAATRYAVFKRIISLTSYTYEWTLSSMANPQLEVDLTQASNLQVTIANNSGTAGMISATPSVTSGTQKMILTLSADANVVDGDEYTITLTEDNGGSATIIVKIKNSISVTLARPTVGKGYFTAVQTNYGNLSNTVSSDDVEGKTITLTHSNQFYQEITAYPETGYSLLRWKHNGQYVSKDNPYKVILQDGDEITAEFVPTGTALFIVKDGDGKEYYSLDDAIAAAQAANKTVVVVKQSGALYTNDKELTNGKYEFTIPAGITLLVPGDEAYTVQNNGVASQDLAGETASSALFRKLELQDNTSIIADGNICVYSKLSTKQGHNGRPYQYGEIKMGNNCQIVLQSGAVLTVFGYISGNPETSFVRAESGATVYEVFQVTDFRGGTATSSSVLKNNKIFPIGQYYIQNVETKLILQHGAFEYVSCTMLKELNMKLVSVDTDDNDEGFLCLGENTQLVKWYNARDDRQNFFIEGKKGVTGATAELGYMYMNLGYVLIMQVEIDSRKYILPINNNIDISINNVTLNAPYDIVFMAGSTLTIDKDAKANASANVYLYDTEQNVGFYYPGNVKIVPINYTIANGANTIGTNAIRRPENIEDAKFLINGKLTINGSFYTTTYGSDVTDAIIQQQNYGANITSNGGGEVVFTNIGTATTISQYTQVGTDLTIINIPVSNARLRNANKSFSAGENANVGENYIYYNDIEGGKWCLPTNAFTTSNISTLAVTIPTASDTQFAEFKLRSTSMQVSDFTVALDNASFKAGEITIEGDKLKVPITYTAQNKQGSATANITLTYTPESFSLTETITATEDYTPAFTVAPTELAFDPIYVNDDAEKALAITPSADNVTTLLDNANMEWTCSTSGANSSEFEFTFGDGSNKLSDGKVTYRPVASGSKSATLTLTATYTDANNAKQTTSVDVPLTATANLNVNTLAFADFPAEIVEEVTEPFLLFKDGSDNAQTEILTELSENGIVEITKTNGEYYVNVLSAGTVTITAVQSASTFVDGCTISTTITVKPKTLLLEHVALCLDTKDKFNIHTISANAVSYSTNNTIDFASTETTSSVWAFQFLGIPDQLIFTPVGGNTWNIEERASDADAWSAVVNWTHFTAGIEVALSLKSTTRQVRIQYGAGQSDVASLSSLCVTAFTIKADVDKLYLPVSVDGTTTSKEVKFTHITEPLNIPTIEGITAVKSTSENKGTPEEPYYETIVTFSATQANKNVTLGAFVTYDEEIHTKNIAIRTYNFPQELPIKLATDNAERYYFVTTAAAYAQWDESTRQIKFQNPGAQLTRSVAFAFNGAPSEIRFDVSSEIYTADWVIKESADGITFTEASANLRTIEGQLFIQPLKYTTRYLLVEYASADLREITLSNLVIEGYPMAWATPEQLSLSEEQKTASFVLTTVNLQNIKVVLDNTDFRITHGSSTEEKTEILLSASDYAGALGVNKVGEIIFNVIWKSTGNVNQGIIYIYNADDNSLLTTVKIVGSKNAITVDDVLTGIYTGIPSGYTSAVGTNYPHHEVSLANAFANDGTALFDYLIIYDETTTTDGSSVITTPTSSAGSNALTPYYIYEKALNSETNKYDGYRFVQLVENVNTPNKAEINGVTTTDGGSLPSIYIDVNTSLRVYMTGFCPYATTGYTKDQEGVWFFRGTNGEKVDIYLEDCHIYSRNKSELGIPMNKSDVNASIFTGDYALGSGGVLVFENTESSINMETAQPLEVTIHTIGNNVFKSNYGSFYEIFGMRAYQISAPLHIHMNSAKHVRSSKTELTLDDVWPTELDADRTITNSIRTNGFLSLQKQSNNAPSIDLGNPHSVVNFCGGQVELQNAQIVSPNYKTTLAISYRSGEYGGDDTGIKFAYGIGTDSVGGTVNFYDGTTTVLPMPVDEKYRQYYLMDVDENGNELTTTSCLRTPRNTYVYGGSQCFMRACSHVTSKGGAPTDGYSQLGQYLYTFNTEEGDQKDEKGLVTAMRFPGNVSGLSEYYSAKGYSPKWESVTPDKNNILYLWIPDGFGGVEAEKDKLLTTWKACMTEIAAGYQGKTGSIGGDTPVEPTEEVKYLLYCQIDENIHNVISAGDKDADGNVVNYHYQAPVKVPDVAQGIAGGKYMNLPPTYVGKDKANQVLSNIDYTITDKVYYITTATADVWMTFTAPFDVEKIWVVETYDEASLEQTPIKNGADDIPLTKRQSVLLEQAEHNADFAAFFGVAMALGSSDDFETIFKDWRDWGIAEDKKAPEGGTALYDGVSDYTLRGKYALEPYDGTNWQSAQFYLNHNVGEWAYTYDDELGEVFIPQWDIPTAAENSDGILLEKGETYSILFPYCTGCWEMNEDEIAKEREYWDYWSGKFLIFEGKSGEQTISGSDFLLEDNANGVFMDEAQLTDIEADLRGNSTFAFMNTGKQNIYPYSAVPNAEAFMYDDTETKTILPTNSFLLLHDYLTDEQGMPARSISRTGKINYGKGNTPSGTQNGNIPTINGGSDIFVTEVVNGINIAVATPQYVRVLSSSGAMLYSGMVESAVDVNLPNNGIYVVAGENTSLKIMY